MRLFIAEKPELARAIASALGGGSRGDGFIKTNKGDVVTWCFGHLLQLEDPEDQQPELRGWSLDNLPMNWQVKHKPIQDKEKQVKIIEELAEQASEIVHAGDPDDEGQLLVDELLEYIGNKKPVKRLLINDLNEKVVIKSLGNLRDNKEFYGHYQSALARSVADQIYGYNMTRAYTLAAQPYLRDKKILSVGRVQTPILGLVVRRDREHENHKAAFYYKVTAEMAGTVGFTANYLPNDETPVDEKGRLADEAYALKVVEDVKGKKAEVKLVKQEKTTPPPLPYNLLNLQADASKKYGYTPDQVMKITQDLREKFKLITYNRSDCQYLSDEQHEDAPQVIEAIKSNLASNIQADPTIKSRAFNSKNVSAHHAIIPTENKGNFEDLTDPQIKVYELIARAYLAQFMKPYKYEETIATFAIGGHEFRARSTKALENGWKDLYQNDEADEESEEEENGDLSALQDGEEIECVNAKESKVKTKPKPLYTMASLLKDLAAVAKYVTDPKIKELLLSKDEGVKGEKGGIGTPATRSAILTNLLQRGFIKEEKKKVVSTDLGRELFDLLPTFATGADLTALWHEQQEEIKKGNLTLDEFIFGVKEQVSEEIERIKEEGLDMEGEIFHCKECNKPLNFLRSSKGDFWGCSGYPDCKQTYRNKDDKPDFDYQPPQVSEEHKCGKCKKGLIRREGQKGAFWGCSGYPDCKNTYPDKEGVPDFDYQPPQASEEHKCGKCKKGLIRREGQKGAFWGCSGYPKCKNTYEDLEGKPDYSKDNIQVSKEHKCPKCKKGLIRRPAKKEGVFWWGCSGFPKCKFTAFDTDGEPDIKDE